MKEVLFKYNSFKDYNVNNETITIIKFFLKIVL